MRIWLLPFLLLTIPAWAGSLTDGFNKALINDPAYRAALAEYEGSTIASTRVGRSYWPQLGLTIAERSESAGLQRTIQVAQPLIDADRYATARGAGPLQFKADATMRQREGELVVRYFKAVAEWVGAREGLRLNKTKAEALEQQALGAQRALDLGAGTITDLRDAQLRLAQARAESLSLKARMEAADRQYQALTGEATPAAGFELARQKRGVPLLPVTDLMQRALLENPGVIVSRQSERLADLDITRKWGQLLPKLNLIAKQTTVGGGTPTQYVGVAFDFPLQTGSLLDIPAANANFRKATEDVRAAEQQVKLESQRLYALVEAGKAESDIRLDVIAAAELSLQANQKSLMGGVRSRLDVLNSIQLLSQTQQDYVTARLVLGESMISLFVLLATSPVEILKQVEVVLF